MIDFIHLVEEFLLEQTGMNATASNNNDNEADVDPLTTFIVSNYTQILGAYKSKYPNNQFVSQEELKSLIYNASNNSLRNVKGDSAFPNLIDTFPLIDFIAELSVYYKRTAKITPEQRKRQSEKILQTFLSKIKNPNTPKIPINFPATTGWAQLVRSSYLSGDKSEMGTMRLDDIPQDSSIFHVIKILLTLRAKNDKSLAKKIKKQTIDYAVNEMDKKIQLIFTNPQYFIKGQEAPPSDEKTKQLYDDVTSQKLVDLSLASFALFKNELMNYVGEVDEKIAIEQYQKFLGVNTARSEQIDWNSLKTQTTQKETSNESFDAHLKDVLKFLENNKISDNLEALLSESFFEVNNKGWDVDFDFSKKTIQVTEKGSPAKGATGSLTPIPFSALIDIIKTKYPQTLVKQIKDFAATTRPPLNPKDDETIVRYIQQALSLENPNEFPTETIIFRNFLQHQILKHNRETNKMGASTGYREPSKPSDDQQSEQRPFETAAGSNLFVYNIGNIKKHQNANPLAGNLYTKLTELADYIKTKHQTDWTEIAQGIGQIAKGLSLGVPSMGSR